MEQPATPSPGRRAKRGRATRPTWSGARKAYDAECAALAKALQVAATRNHTLGLVTILTGCQEA